MTAVALIRERDRPTRSIEGRHPRTLEVTIEHQGQMLNLVAVEGLHRRPDQDAPEGRPKRLGKGLSVFAEFQFGTLRVDREDQQFSNAEKDGLCVGRSGSDNRPLVFQE